MNGFRSDLNLILMLVRESQRTIDCTRMIKIVDLFVRNIIGFMECNKDTLKDELRHE